MDERASGITPTREQVAPLPVALLPYLGVDGVEVTQGTLFGWEKVAAENRPTSLFTCPDATPLDFNPPQTTMLAVGGLGYTFAWNVPFDYGVNEGVFGFVYDRSFDTRRLRGHLGRVKDSSRTLLLADADANRARGSLMAWQPALDEQGPTTLFDSLTTLADGDDRLGPAIDAERHRGRLNALSADGHVAASATDIASLKELYLLPANP